MTNFAPAKDVLKKHLAGETITSFEETILPNVSSKACYSHDEKGKRVDIHR